MTDIKKPVLPARAEREKALAADRRKILGMTPEQALDTVADHPYPVTLVQSFAEEDLYLLVHTIGPDDALPILGLASNEQWEYFLDNDTWARDRLDLKAVTRWLDRLLKADPDRFTHWITSDQTDTLAFYLFHNIEVVLREHDEDPSDFGEGFFTEDQTHFVRLRPIDLPRETGNQYEEDRDVLVNDLLKRIAVYDYPRYVAMLLESGGLLPAEAEEELYRLRNIRLAEKGFIPHDEAIGVYQALTAEALKTRIQKPMGGGRSVDAYPMPLVTRTTPVDANRFAKALANVQDEGAYHYLQSEFAGLCNQVIAADRVTVREKETLDHVVTKVSNFISLGLEKVAAQSGQGAPAEDTRLIQSHMLSDLFRVGYGCALDLKWKAERWQRSAWAFQKGLPLGFWGEAGMGLLGGLLLKKPLRYTPQGKGSLYEEFATLEQIHMAARALEAVMAYDHLLGAMDIDIKEIRSHGFLTYQNLLLTLWGHHYSGRDDTVLAPLPLDAFRSLFEALWKADTPTPAIKDDIKDDFLNWLAKRSGMTALEISDRMGAALTELFRTVEEELGPVDPRYLDPRFIHLFILKADQP